MSLFAVHILALGTLVDPRGTLLEPDDPQFTRRKGLGAAKLPELTCTSLKSIGPEYETAPQIS
jgi:hypothetical protein